MNKRTMQDMTKTLRQVNYAEATKSYTFSELSEGAQHAARMRYNVDSPEMRAAIYLDPKNADIVYFFDTRSWRFSENGERRI